ncbi:MAG: NAD-dependent epimerase/dehydratase family protein [Pseudomonadota bacterium]
MQLNDNIIGIFGGTGFIGTSFANQLVANGARVRVYTRNLDKSQKVSTLPGVEQRLYDPTSPDSINDITADVDTLVNLVGILNERGDNGKGFRRVHVDLTERLLAACRQNQIARFVYLSALQADPFANSYYLRTKGEAEQLIRNATATTGLISHIVRPSVVFGPGDDFTNRFATLIRLMPGFFPLASTESKFQPIYLHNLIEFLIALVANPDLRSARHDVGGPDVVSLGEIVTLIAKVMNKRLHVIALPNAIAKLQANILEYVPGKPLSRDNLRSLQNDSVVVGTNALDEFGIAKSSMAAILPSYLGTDTPQLRRDSWRTGVKRNQS